MRKTILRCDACGREAPALFLVVAEAVKDTDPGHGPVYLEYAMRRMGLVAEVCGSCLDLHRTALTAARDE